jgi:hypothetical protein
MYLYCDAQANYEANGSACDARFGFCSSNWLSFLNKPQESLSKWICNCNISKEVENS